MAWHDVDNVCWNVVLMPLSRVSSRPWSWALSCSVDTQPCICACEGNVCHLFLLTIRNGIPWWDKVNGDFWQTVNNEFSLTSSQVKAKSPWWETQWLPYISPCMSLQGKYLHCEFLSISQISVERSLSWQYRDEAIVLRRNMLLYLDSWCW